MARSGGAMLAVACVLAGAVAASAAALDRGSNGSGSAMVGDLREPASRSAADLARARRACAKFVAERGSDAWPGTRRRPLRTIQHLTTVIDPGDVGCLRRGTYAGDLRFDHGGTADRPVVIRSYPGESARVVGRLWVPRSTEHITFRDLWLDGRNSRLLPSPTVNGDFIRFDRVDVTNRNNGICFLLGHEDYGTTEGTEILRSRIHHCGRLPATNHDHGIYASNSRAARIEGNWIYANADRGIQFYPDAQGTIVRGNVIDGNGQGIIFSGDDGVASGDNIVEGNVITNSVLRHNVESWYPGGGPVGSGNVVRNNCLGGGPRDQGFSGGVQLPAVGFALVDNLRGRPRFVDAKAHDYRMRPGRCRQVFTAIPDARRGPLRRPPPLPAS